MGVARSTPGHLRRSGSQQLQRFVLPTVVLNGPSTQGCTLLEQYLEYHLIDNVMTMKVSDVD
jgi:hypothetical protein